MRQPYGVREGPDPMSLWPRYLTHCKGAINQEPTPLATVPNVVQGKLTLLPHPYLVPCNRLSWHDGGYMLTMQATATCLICWKVKLRLWNVSNCLFHIGKSKGCMVFSWLLSWVTYSEVRVYVWISVHVYKCRCPHLPVCIWCQPWAFCLYDCKAKFKQS